MPPTRTRDRMCTIRDRSTLRKALQEPPRRTPGTMSDLSTQSVWPGMNFRVTATRELSFSVRRLDARAAAHTAVDYRSRRTTIMTLTMTQANSRCFGVQTSASWCLTTPSRSSRGSRRYAPTYLKVNPAALPLDTHLRNRQLIVLRANRASIHTAIETRHEGSVNELSVVSTIQ